MNIRTPLEHCELTQVRLVRLTTVAYTCTLVGLRPAFRQVCAPRFVYTRRAISVEFRMKHVQSLTVNRKVTKVEKHYIDNFSKFGKLDLMMQCVWLALPSLPILHARIDYCNFLYYSTVLRSLKWIASNRFRTVLHVLWLKLVNFLISHPSSVKVKKKS